MPIACAPTVGRVASNVSIAAWRLRAACPRGRARGARRASPCRRAGSEPGTRQSSRTTSAVCEARMPCFLNFCPSRGPCVPGGTTNAAWPREPSSRVDRRDDDVHVGDAAVGGPRLGAVEHPLVLGLVVDARACAASETSEPASGSETQNAPTFGSSGVPKHCGTHSPICSGVPLAKIAGDGERRADDRQADAGVAPEQLLVDDRERQAGRVGVELARAPRSRRGRSWPPPG